MPPLNDDLTMIAGSLALTFTTGMREASAADIMGGQLRLSDRAAPSLDPTAPPATEPAPAPAPPVPAQPTTAAPGPAGTISADIEPGLYRVERGPDGQSLQATPVEANGGGGGSALLRPTDKKHFVTVMAGGSVELLTHPSDLRYPTTGTSGFAPELAVGRYGDNRSNVGYAFVVSGQRSNELVGGFRIGGRIQWDKQLHPNFAIYSSTKLTLGLEANFFRGGVSGGYYSYSYETETYGSLGGFFEFGWGVDAIIAERLVLSFRPANVSLSYTQWVGDNGLAHDQTDLPGLRWTVLGGVGYRW